jgi:hypothetical protein
VKRGIYRKARNLTTEVSFIEEEVKDYGKQTWNDIQGKMMQLLSGFDPFFVCE